MLTATPPHNNRNDKQCILLVDDSPEEQRRVLDLLRPYYRTLVAFNGEQGYQRALASQPDLILMDVSMPVMDGIEATRRVTAEFPGVKVIGLSMHDDMSHGEAMRRAGAVDFLDKNGPFAEVVTTARLHAGLPWP